MQPGTKLIRVPGSLAYHRSSMSDASRVRGYAWWLAAIFALGFALRVAMAAAFVGLDSPPDPDANIDQVEYEEFGHQLALGNGYSDAEGNPTAIRPPGTSAALVPVYSLLGRSWPAGRIWFCFLSAATGLAVAWGARRMFDERTALLAALWFALYPGSTYYSMHFLSEVPFGLLTSLWAAAAYAAYRRGGVLWLELFAGLCLGLSVLTRPQAVFMLPAMWGLVVLLPRLRKRTVLVPALLQSLVVLAVVFPWAGRNQAVLGKFTVSTIGGCTFWGANNELVASTPGYRGSWVPITMMLDDAWPKQGTEVERDAAAWQRGLAFVREHPGEFAILLLYKVWHVMTPYHGTENDLARYSFFIAWLVTGPLVLLGLWWIWRRDGAAFLLLMLPILSLLVTTLVFYGSVRFRDSIISVLVIPAAYAFVRLIESRTEKTATS